MDFVIDGHFLYYYFTFSTETIRQFKLIPENLRSYDTETEAWRFPLKNFPIIEQYLSIPFEIKEQYEQYLRIQKEDQYKSDFIITIDASYCVIKPNKPNLEINWGILDEVCVINIPNAKYTNAYKQGTWDGKYHLFNMHLKRFPTGLLSKICIALEIEYYKYELQYQYTNPPLHQFQWELHHISFREYQLNTIQTAFDLKRGILQLATGAGKTMLASGIIQRFGVKTLFLVHTKDLLYQTYNVFKSVFKDTKIGLIGDGNATIENITIATMQSIASKLPYSDNNYGDVKYDIDDEYTEDDIILIKEEKPTNITSDTINELIQSTQLLICDECLIGDTLIELENGLFKKIKDIQNGDKIIGGIVSHKFQKEVSNTIKIITGFSELETSETHPNFIIEKLPYKSHQYWNPNESDIIIKKSNELQVGNYLLIPNQLEHHITHSKYNDDLLYFVGFFLGDGHIDKTSYRLKFEFHNKEKCEIIESIYQKILFDIDPISILQTKEKIRTDIKNFDEYYTKIIWCNSKKLRELLINTFLIPIGKKSNIITISDNIINNSLKSLKSFIQGCFDSEGWVITKNKRIGIGYSSLIFIQQLQFMLLKFGIKSKIYERKRKNVKHKSLFMLDITGEDLIIYGNEIGFRIKSKKENMNYILQNIPNRTYNHYVNYLGKKYWLSQIKTIESNINSTIVYDFTTDSHNFIANGFLTHNCQHLPAQTMYKIAMRVNTPYKFGLSATPYRDDGFQMKIEAGLGNIIYKLSASKLINEGYLVKPFIKCIKVPQVDYPRKTLYNQVYQKYIVENQTRNEMISLLAQDEMKKGHQVLILVKQIKHLNTLQQLIPNSITIEGKMKSIDRKQILSEFQTKKFQCLIATTVFDEGVDVPCLNVLILAGSGKSSTKALQRIGRVIRLGDQCPQCQSTQVIIKNKHEPCQCKQCGKQFPYHGKDHAIVYDFIDQTKWLYEQYHKRLDMYETEEQFEISKHNIKYHQK